MPTIAEIHTIPFRLPLKSALRWGQAGHLAELEHVLVRVVTDTGHTGWGEATPRPTIYGETAASIEAIIEQQLAPRLVGMAVDDEDEDKETAAINQAMQAIANNHTAKGAIDIALHEAIAATRGQSLLDYLDPPQRRIKVSYILGMADHAAMLAEAKAVYDQGVRVLKVKVGRDFEGDVALIRKLQAEFAGSGLTLYADANEGLQPDQAERQLRRLADLGVLYVEEPLPVELLWERAALRQAEALPIIADDSTFTWRDFQRELRFDTFDILNIKTARTGYTTSRQMLEAARQRGKGVMIGSQASATLGTIRAAIFAGLAGVDHPSELSFFLKLADELVTHPLSLNEGYLELDSLAGITLDEERLARFRLKPT